MKKFIVRLVPLFLSLTFFACSGGADFLRKSNVGTPPPSLTGKDQSGSVSQNDTSSASSTSPSNSSGTTTPTGTGTSPSTGVMPQLQCASDKTIVLAKGQSAVVVLGSNLTGSISDSISANPMISDDGSLSSSSPDNGVTVSVTYNAPAAIPMASQITVSASLGNVAASCKVSLQADATIGVPDMGQKGVPGNIYNTLGMNPTDPTLGLYIPPASSVIDSWTPVGTIVVPNFAFPSGSYTNPFPGIANNLSSWYIVAFHGNLVVNQPGNYKIYVCSDDASMTFIDGNLTNDLSQHHFSGPTCIASSTLSLAAGNHPFRLNYLQDQGPTFRLEVSWAAVDQNGNLLESYSYIPPANFSR